MKKILLTAFASVLALSSTFAQDYSDASEYFTGNAYGWATCSDEQGTAYEMNGGMRASQPKTVILYASGSDDAQTIISAIANYDIIVLDGSKGDFIINAQMGINSAKNKTIVGRNNARLCTQFYLTDDDLAYLKAQNLDGLSSTDQYTGTLPNGVTLTCDKRAFFTKKAMMELQFQKTGVYSLPNNAGIFALSSTDENIIFRNLTLVGPGSVDIDGVDLITNQESKNVWVDHCTFIDSQDGALDSKRCDYASYTWNKFLYTSRSYSHAYTCGCGWADGSMTLHLTFANNEWGEGCVRRLPQCGDCYVHLFNNYHNCPGNSAGMTINDGCKALVENNYAASGVNLPLTGSGSNRTVQATGNSFSFTSTGTVTVPYEYTKVSNIYVPLLAKAKNGPGATLEYFMPGTVKALSTDNFGFYETSVKGLKGNKLLLPVKNLLGATMTLTSSNPEVAIVQTDNATLSLLSEGTTTITATSNDALYGVMTAQIMVTVTAGGEYESFKLWNFKRSDETTAALEASDWSGSGDVYTLGEALNNEPLMVDENTPYAEAVGLLFTTPADKLVSYKDRIRFNKENVSNLTIPDLKKDDKIQVKWKSASSSSSRGFNCSNLSVSELRTDGNIKTDGGIVLADGDVVLTVSGGLYLYTVEVLRQGGSDTTDIMQVNESTNSQVNAMPHYNISGQCVNGGYKGITIQKGKKYLNK